MKGADFYGALSEGCVGGNCINTFSKTEDRAYKIPLPSFYFSFFHDPGQSKADSAER